MPSGGNKRVTATLDIQAQITKYQESLNKLQGALGKLHLPDGLRKGFENLFVDYQRELEKLSKSSANNKLSVLNEKEIEKSFDKIDGLYGSLIKKLRSSGYEDSILESDFKAIEQMKAAQEEYSKAVKGSAAELEKEQKALDKIKAKLEDQKKQQKSLGSQKGGAATSQKYAQKAVEDTNKALQAQKEVVQSLKDQHKEQEKTIKSVASIQEKALNTQANAERKLAAFREVNKGKTDDKTRERELNLIKEEEAATARVQKANEDLAAAKAHNLTIEQSLQKESAKQSDLEAKASEAKTRNTEATRKLTNVTNSYNKKVEEVRQTEEQLGQQNKTVQEKQQAYESLVRDTLTKVVEGLKAVAEAAGIDVSQIKSIEDVNKALEDLSDEAKDRAAPALKNAEQSVEDMGESSARAKQGFLEAAEGLHQLSDRQKEVERLSQSVLRFFSIDNAVRLFKRAVRSAYETIKDLDAVMTETAVVTDFSVGDMWSQLPEYTKRANELGVSIHSVYEASTLYYQQGLKTNEVMAVTNATLRMARIAGLDAAEATDRVTNALRGFNMEINEANADRIADVYSKLAAISASDVDEISTAMTKVASLANSANMEFENTAAFLAQIIETTRESAETAGTALKTVIARFSEVKKLYSEGQLLGTDSEGEAIDVNKVSTALRTAGIDLNEFLTGAKGLDEVFVELASKWNSLDIVQQRYIATMAAGSRQQSRFIALMSDYQRTQELTAAAQDANGASMEQYEKTLDSLQSKLAQLENAWNEFTMSITNSELVKFFVDAGTQILNVINAITGAFGDFGSGFSKVLLLIGGIKLGKTIFSKLIDSVVEQFVFAGQKSGESFIKGFVKKADLRNLKGFGEKAISELDKSIIDAAKKTEPVPLVGNNGIIKPDLPAGALKPYAESIRRQIAEYIGDDATTGARAINIFNAGIDSNENATKVINDVNGELEKVGASLKVTKDMAHQAGSSITSSFQTAAMAAGALSMVIGLLGTGLEKLGLEGASKTLGHISKGLGILTMMLTAMPALLNLVGAAASAAWASATLGISLVISLLVTLIGIIGETYESQAKKAEKLNEDIKSITQNLEETKTTIKSLGDTKNNFDELQKELQNLTVGTIEWRQKLIEVNQQVLELIDKYPILLNYIERSSNGGMSIRESGWEALTKELAEQSINLTSAQIGLKMQQTSLAQRQTFSDFSRDNDINRENNIREEDSLFNKGWFRNFLSNYIEVGNSRVMRGITSLGISELVRSINPYTYDKKMEKLPGAVSYLSFGATEENINKIAITLAEKGISISDTTDNIRNALNGIVDVSNDTINQLKGMGNSFDEFGIQLLESKNQLEIFKENLITEAVTSDEELLGSGLENQIIEALKFKNKDIERAKETFVREIYELSDEKLKKMYEEEVGGFFENGKLYSDASMQNELDLSRDTLLNSIATTRLTKQMQKDAKIVKNQIVQIKSIDKDRGLLIERALTKNGEGLRREDLDEEHWRQTLNIIKEEFKNMGIDNYNIVPVQDLWRRNNQLLENLPDTLSNNIKNLNLSLGAENNLLSTLQNVSGNTQTKIYNLIAEFGTVLQNNGSSPEEVSKAFEYIASSDFSSASSIESIADYLNELDIEVEDNEIDNFIKDLIELTNATKEFSLENVINELKTTKDIIDSLFDGKRDFTEEQYLQAIKNGMDPEQFVKTVDGWRYIGKISEGVTQNIEGQQKEIDSMLLNFKQVSDLLNINPSKITIPNVIDRKSGTIEFDGSNYVAPGGSKYTEEYKTELQAEKDKAIEEITQTIQALVSTGNLQGMLGVQESIFDIKDIETKTLLFKEFDKALIGVGQTYTDLYQEVKNLEKAESSLEKSQARLNLMLKLDAKQSEKEFKNLSNVIESSTDALKYKDEDIVSYNNALSDITSAASIAFKDNENITTEFVENNLKLFQDFANGVEGSEDRIREALISVGNYTEEEGNLIADTLDYLRNNSDFQINGTADFSNIFNMFVKLIGSAEEAREFIERELGFTVDYTPIYEDIFTGRFDNGYPVMDHVLKRYESKITDGFSNTRRANTAAARKKDTGSKGGGSSKSDKPKNWKNPYDELYNLEQEINETTRQRNLLEAEYDLMLNDRTKANDVLLKNSYEQLKNLEKELALQKQLQAGRKSQLDDILNETYEDSEGNRKTFGELGVGKYAHYDEESRTIVIDWEGLEALAAKAGSEEEGKAVEEYIKKLEDLVGQFEEVDSKILEIEKEVQDIRMRGMDKVLELQERVREAFIQARQDEIDELQAVSDTIEESTSRVIDGIREQVEAERQARENEKAEEDIADKEMRLAYLQRDTSGANDLEILKLNEELADARQDYTDSLIDQGIEKMQEQAEKAQQQRQKQIDLMTSQLAWDQKNGKFNEAVNTVLTAAFDTNGTMTKAITGEGGIKGYITDMGNGMKKFVTSDGKVLQVTAGDNGGMKVVLPDGSTTALTKIGDVETGVNGLKNILSDAEGVPSFTDEKLWDWEKKLLIDIKEGTEGWANFKVKQAEDAGEVYYGKNGKGGHAKYDSTNKRWIADDGTIYTKLIYENGMYKLSGKYVEEKPKEEEKKDTPKIEVPQDKGTEKKQEKEKQSNSPKTIKGYTYTVTYTGNDPVLTERVKYDGTLKDSLRKEADKKGWGKDNSYTTGEFIIKRTPKYKTGGLVDFTGPAWLDGTKTKPEIVLNQADSQNFIILKDILSQLLRNPIQSGSQGAGGDNYYEINIDAEIANDYDVDRLASRIKQQIYSDGMYRNVNTLNWQR